MASFASMILLMWVFSCTLCSASLDTNYFPYEEYCHDTLSTNAEEEGHQHDIPPTSDFHLSFQTAFFSGGFPLFDTNFTTFSLHGQRSSAASFSAKLAGEQEERKHVVEGSLLLQRSPSRFRSSTRVTPQSGARWHQPEGIIRLTLKGLWVARSETLCMAGCFKENVLGHSINRDNCQVKAVFHYPLKNSMSQPFVKGVIESKREQHDPLFFEPVAITAVPEAPYIFRKDDENAEDCPLVHPNVPKNIKVWDDAFAICQFPWHREQFTVSWDTQCTTAQDCSPFEDVKPGSPTTLSVENMVCAQGKIRGFFIFSHQQANTSQTAYDVFAVEGAWNTHTDAQTSFVHHGFCVFHFILLADRFFSMATSEEKSKRNMNISFDLYFFRNEKGMKLLENTSLYQILPAEGVYNSKTGMLCLIACRPLTVSKARTGSKLQDGNKDCEMLVTIQYPPINPGYFGEHRISGKVMSLREQKDDLFFNPAFVSSTSFYYQEHARNFLVLIDFEVIMGIISLTMAVLFIGLQLSHVKKNPKVLSHMSLLMLTVLTLGHLIPLVLKLEEIFSSRSRQDVLLWRGGWLEINEVIIGLMTMLVFLMLIRLLYRSWVSKSEVSASEGPCHMEGGALCICLTLYALGGLIALIVYGVSGSDFSDVTKAFTGLTIDFFLFPQVVANYFWQIQGTVLSSPFYVGMTLVRSWPHLFGILRKFEFLPFSNRRYFYAHPSWDFYSNAWDAIVPIGNLLLAVLVFFQQRYGGAFFSIASWRKARSYMCE